MNYINLLHDNNKQSLFSRPTANPAGSSSAAVHAVRKMTGTAERQERDMPAKARRELPAKPPPFFYVLKYTIKANPSPNGNGFAFNLFGDPTGTRTRVTAVKGRCLRPLDHGAVFSFFVPVSPPGACACGAKFFEHEPAAASAKERRLRPLDHGAVFCCSARRRLQNLSAKPACRLW